jgi:hypothetical protein
MYTPPPPRLVDPEYLEKVYSECPELVSLLKEFLVAGYEVKKNTNRGVIINSDPNASIHEEWIVFIWHTQGVWKVSWGRWDGSKKEPAYIQCSDLDQVLFYVKHWKHHPPVYKK